MKSKSDKNEHELIYALRELEISINKVNSIIDEKPIENEYLFILQVRLKDLRLAVIFLINMLQKREYENE